MRSDFCLLFGHLFHSLRMCVCVCVFYEIVVHVKGASVNVKQRIRIRYSFTCSTHNRIMPTLLYGNRTASSGKLSNPIIIKTTKYTRRGTAAMFKRSLCMTVCVFFQFSNYSNIEIVLETNTSTEMGDFSSLFIVVFVQLFE